jgi:ketosteroid isomerase-like protein
MRPLFPAFFLMLLLGSCKNRVDTQTTSSSVEVNNGDSIAILKAIETETRNFYKKDHSRWSESYVQNDKVYWICVEPDVSLRAKGWNDLSNFVAEWMKANPEPMDYEKSKFITTKVNLEIKGDMAFVTLQGSNLNEDGKTIRYTMGSRTMIKENGKWKILAMCSYPDDSPEGSSSNIYKHRM